MPDISKITMPSGTTYDIKDATARELISTGITFTKSTSADTTPAGVTWNNSGTTITGTLAASADTVGYIYLVPASKTETKDIFEEYVTVQDGGAYSWERFGNTEITLSDLGNLAYEDSVTLNKDTVTVLGTNSTISVTKPTASVTPTTATAITGLGDASTDDFVKSYPGATSKMNTVSIVPTDGTVSIPNVTGNTDVVATAVSSFGTPATWSFTVTNETLTITGANGAAASGSNVTASKVTLGTNLTAAKVGNATTVATGALSASGSGASVMTGLGTATTGAAVTSIGVASTSSFMVEASVDVSQPTASISADSKTVLTNNTTITIS